MPKQRQLEHVEAGILHPVEDYWAFHAAGEHELVEREASKPFHYHPCFAHDLGLPAYYSGEIRQLDYDAGFPPGYDETPPDPKAAFPEWRVTLWGIHAEVSANPESVNWHSWRWRNGETNVVDTFRLLRGEARFRDRPLVVRADWSLSDPFETTWSIHGLPNLPLSSQDTGYVRKGYDLLESAPTRGRRPGDGMLFQTEEEFRGRLQSGLDAIPPKGHPTKERVTKEMSIHRDTLDQYLALYDVDWATELLNRSRRLKLIQ